MKEPTKGNFIQPLSINKIEDEFEFSKDDYYSDFSISNDEDLQLHFKRKHNFCFPNFFLCLFLISIRRRYKCVNISQKLKINAFVNNMHHASL